MGPNCAIKVTLLFCHYCQSLALQAAMLPLENRQLVSVGSNSSTPVVQPHTLHHPIVILTSTEDNVVVEKLVCRNGDIIIANTYRTGERSWRNSASLDTLASER